MTYLFTEILQETIKNMSNLFYNDFVNTNYMLSCVNENLDCKS